MVRIWNAIRAAPLSSRVLSFVALLTRPKCPAPPTGPQVALAPVLLPGESEPAHTSPKRKRGTSLLPRWRLGLAASATADGRGWISKSVLHQRWLMLYVRLAKSRRLAWLKDLWHDEVRWYAASGCLHFVLFLGLLLIPPAVLPTDSPDTVAFLAPEVNHAEPREFDKLEIGDVPLEPADLRPETLRASPIAQPAKFYDHSPVFQWEGGGTPTPTPEPLLGGQGGFSSMNLGPGPRLYGNGGGGHGRGLGTRWGSGGAGEGFGSRGRGHQAAVVAFGGTPGTERGVAAALDWFARHQGPSGSWSLGQYGRHCKGRPCGAPSSFRSDAAATAMAVLPFLAAGQTHKANGPYRENVHRALVWLVKQQKADGDLSAGGDHRMYTHGLATIALCEAYGMTSDPSLGRAAQAAVMFIERAQDVNSSGWRYQPNQFGDTSVFGWQVMALKSAQMAGVPVFGSKLELCNQWLERVAHGEHRGLYCYQPYREPSTTMTAVGMLCRQYLGAPLNDAAMNEGKEYLKQHPPENSMGTPRDIYYWYYATQVMFNIGGPEWDDWNRRMRRTLIETQVREDCAAGSWDPDKPTVDDWGVKGGRIMTTAFSTLTLEIYYRYLPLYRLAPPPAERKGGESHTPPPAPVVVPSPENTEPAPARGIGF